MRSNRISTKRICKRCTTALLFVAVSSQLSAQLTGWTQWTIAQGGNGHWYRVASQPTGLNYDAATALAIGSRGYLATITSAAENAFVSSLLNHGDPNTWEIWSGVYFGPWIGGAAPISRTNALFGWSWVTGEPWSYSNWHQGEPSNGGGTENLTQYVYHPFIQTYPYAWNDRKASWPSVGDSEAGKVRGAVLERASDPRMAGLIAFHSTRDGNAEVYSMSDDGSGAKRLTNEPAFDGGASFSPDGNWVVFFSYRDGNGEVYKMRADGTSLVNLTRNAGNEEFPAWSPDGTRIAFHSSRDGNNEIYVMNSDGTGQQRLTFRAENDFWPRWSPDGSRIAFRSNPYGGPADIYTMHADGTALSNLTNSAANDNHPAWSPDGTRIAFHSDRTGNQEIFVMNSDGTNPQNLTQFGGSDQAPDWSPDGTRIVFNSDRSGVQQLYVMMAGGGGPAVALGGNPGAEDFLASWYRQDVTRSPKLSGRILFSDFVGVRPDRIVVEFRQPGSVTADLATEVAVAADGSFSASPAAPGTWDVSIKKSHWLRRTLRLNLAADLSGQLFRLSNGDVDGDNLVSILDYLDLSAAYESVPGGAGWDPDADLDGDGNVSILDYLILSTNYERSGDD
jgi:Tol biopolymer transport system component